MAITTPQKPNAAVSSPWTCSSGRAEATGHTWIYMGRKSQLYRCTSCVGTITKSALKKETEASA